MIRYFQVLCLSSWLFTCSFANDIVTEDKHPVKPETSALEDEVPNDVETSIEKIEDFAAQAEKVIKEGILPVEHTHAIYSKMEETVEELLDLSNGSLNVYKFLSAKGIERTFLPNIGIPYPPLKRQLLLLIKNLFDIAPITTNAVIPIGVVDKVLDIFDKDDNLALKAHALDILSVWLPENPTVQTRVMKLSGLEPFYQQIPKLDVEVIGQLLELFNKILVEHVTARKKDMQRSKADHDKLIMYQRIGLIERLSTPVACNGLLNILEKTWSFNTNEKDNSKYVIETIKNVQPLCINIYKAMPKPKNTKLFTELFKYLDDPAKKDYLEKLGMNITNTQIILQEYSNIFDSDHVKDEF